MSHKLSNYAIALSLAMGLDSVWYISQPMIAMGTKDIYMQEDRWGIVTRDKKPAAHYEHSICVRKGKADILSSFEEIEKVLREKSL